MDKNNSRYMKDEYLKTIKTYLGQLQTAHTPDISPIVQRYAQNSNLKSSNFFYDTLLKRSISLDYGIPKKPVVGYFCNLVPEEVISAAGAIGVRLCSSDDACAHIGEEIIPGDFCSMIKSSCGALFTRRYDNLDLVVVPAACDGKLKLAEVLSPFKEVYFLDLPRDSDYLKNAEIWTQKYSQFAEFLRKRYNARANREDLLNACKLTNKRTDIFRKIYSLRASHPGIINAFDYFAIASASFVCEADIWSAYAEKFYKEAECLTGKGPDFKGKKILLAGSSIIFPNYKILDILNELGCDISADTTCSAYGRMYDPVEIDEDTQDGILRALSLKYIAASMCPCFLGVDKLIDRVVEISREHSLDGVIYHNFRLCQVFEMQSFALRHILKDRGLPFLFIKTDLGKEDTGQIKTRIEAFLEMLQPFTKLV